MVTSVNAKSRPRFLFGFTIKGPLDSTETSDPLGLAYVDLVSRQN